MPEDRRQKHSLPIVITLEVTKMKLQFQGPWRICMVTKLFSTCHLQTITFGEGQTLQCLASGKNLNTRTVFAVMASMQFLSTQPATEMQETPMDSMECLLNHHLCLQGVLRKHQIQNTLYADLQDILLLMRYPVL